MHGHVKVGPSDIPGSNPPPGCYAKPGGFGVALNVDSSEEAERSFGALSERGSVTMHLGETFFAHRFAVVTDRYAIPWLIVHGRE